MKKPDFNGGIFLNIDIDTVTFPFLQRAVEEENFTKETLYPFVDQYVGSQVKALAFNVFSMRSATPSNVWDDEVKISKRTIENGIPVDYSKENPGLVKCYEEKGVDPYAVWFDRCRQQGIEAWFSLRMNDCHCPLDPTYHSRSEFFYEAKKNGWMVGELPRHGLHFSVCYDYAVPQIRQKMLDYIEEQLNRYDLDGVELDFMREIFCFKYMECADKVEIMNEFIRNVKRITLAAGEKHGHPVKIMVRLPRDIDQCLVYGFDVATWDAEKLVDSICVTARYHSCDSDMPIAVWKQRCSHIAICAGMEMNYYRPRYKIKINPDMANGLTAAYVSQGSDMTYMYNFFANPYTAERDLEQRTYNMIKRIGSGDTIFSTRRRHVITQQDEEMTPIGYEPYRPLPAILAAGETKAFSLPIGYVPEGKTARLVLGMEKGAPADMHVIVNGKPCCNLTEADADTKASLESEGESVVADSVTLYTAEIPARSLGRYTISVTAKADIEVDYIEVDIQ